MKKIGFNMHKWMARSLVAIGALLGISSCAHKVVPGPTSGVYGPPPGYTPPKINVMEDVYGPPVESIDTISDTDKPELMRHESEQAIDIEL